MATATISQKIFSRASGSTKMVEPGEIVEAGVDYAMSHDGTSVLAIKAFQEMGSEKVWDPESIVIPFDHIVPANNETAAELQRDVRAWAKEQKIKSLFDCGSGVCHQVFPEQGFALPGLLAGRGRFAFLHLRGLGGLSAQAWGRRTWLRSTPEGVCGSRCQRP